MTDNVGVDLLGLLTQVIAKLRWEESSILPLPRVREKRYIESIASAHACDC